MNEKFFLIKMSFRLEVRSQCLIEWRNLQNCDVCDFLKPIPRGRFLRWGWSYFFSFGRKNVSIINFL